jgi:dsRNA-specific ribonuclease
MLQPTKSKINQLQEYCQSIKLGLPHYTEVKCTGLDHEPWFQYQVSFGGHTILGEFRQWSKKDARKSAARNALIQCSIPYHTQDSIINVTTSHHHKDIHGVKYFLNDDCEKLICILGVSNNQTWNRMNTSEDLFKIRLMYACTHRTALEDHSTMTLLMDYKNKHGGIKMPMEDYKTLETMGDSVIGTILTEYICIYIDQEENQISNVQGHITQCKSQYLSNHYLRSVMLKKKLNQWIMTTHSNIEKCMIPADVFEAIMGACFLTYGYPVARNVFLNLMDFPRKGVEQIPCAF